MSSGESLPRLMVISSGSGDPTVLLDALEQAISGGARLIQLRERSLSARRLAELSASLRELLKPVDGVLILNDRVDVVAAGYADGVHLGFRSIRVGEARAILGAGPLVGASVHDEEELRASVSQGADYVTLSPVHRTGSHPDARPLGVEQARRLTERAGLPVFWLGGVSPDDWSRCESAHGLAALSPFADPKTASERVREFLGASEPGRHAREG